MSETDIMSMLALYKANDDMGIYPQACIGGDKPYEKRTDYMEGWNAYGTALTDKWCAISKWLRAIPEEIKSDIQQYILEGLLNLSVGDGDIALWVDCSDLFYWACADGEDFEYSDLPELKKAFVDAPKHGAILWCCRKRGMRPQGPYYKYFDDDEKIFFDATGPERTDA